MWAGYTTHKQLQTSFIVSVKMLHNPEVRWTALSNKYTSGDKHISLQTDGRFTPSDIFYTCMVGIVVKCIVNDMIQRAHCLIRLCSRGWNSMVVLLLLDWTQSDTCRQWILSQRVHSLCPFHRQSSLFWRAEQCISTTPLRPCSVACPTSQRLYGSSSSAPCRSVWWTGHRWWGPDRR